MIHQYTFTSILALPGYAPEEVYADGDLLFAYVDRAFLFGHKMCGIFRLHSGYAASGETHDGVHIIASSAIADYYWERISHNVPKVWTSPATELTQNQSVTVTHDADTNNERIVNVFRVVIASGTTGFIDDSVDSLENCEIGPVNQTPLSNPLGVRRNPGTNEITLNGERVELVSDSVVSNPGGEYFSYWGNGINDIYTCNVDILTSLPILEYTDLIDRNFTVWLKEDSPGVYSWDEDRGHAGSHPSNAYYGDYIFYKWYTYSEPHDNSGVYKWNGSSWDHIVEYNQYFETNYEDLIAVGRGGYWWMWEDGRLIASYDVSLGAPNPPYTYRPSYSASCKQWQPDDVFDEEDGDPFRSLSHSVGHFFHVPYAKNSRFFTSAYPTYDSYGLDSWEGQIVYHMGRPAESGIPEENTFTVFSGSDINSLPVWACFKYPNVGAGTENRIALTPTVSNVTWAYTTVLTKNALETASSALRKAVDEPDQPNNLITTMNEFSTPFGNYAATVKGHTGISNGLWIQNQRIWKFNASDEAEAVSATMNLIVDSTFYPAPIELHAIAGYPLDESKGIFFCLGSRYYTGGSPQYVDTTGSGKAVIGELQISSTPVYEAAYILKPANIAITSPVTLSTPTIVSTDVNGAICRFALTDLAGNLYKWSGTAWVTCTYLTANTKTEFLAANFTQLLTDVSGPDYGICVVLHPTATDAPVFESIDFAYTKPGEWQLDEDLVVDNAGNKVEIVSSTQTKYTNLDASSKKIVLRVGII